MNCKREYKFNDITISLDGTVQSSFEQEYEKEYKAYMERFEINNTYKRKSFITNRGNIRSYNNASSFQKDKGANIIKGPYPTLNDILVDIKAEAKQKEYQISEYVKAKIKNLNQGYDYRYRCKKLTIQRIENEEYLYRCPVGPMHQKVAECNKECPYFRELKKKAHFYFDYLWKLGELEATIKQETKDING